MTFGMPFGLSPTFNLNRSTPTRPALSFVASLAPLKAIARQFLAFLIMDIRWTVLELAGDLGKRPTWDTPISVAPFLAHGPLFIRRLRHLRPARSITHITSGGKGDTGAKSHQGLARLTTAERPAQSREMALANPLQRLPNCEGCIVHSVHSPLLVTDPVDPQDS